MRSDLGKVSGASDFKALAAKLRTEQNVPGMRRTAYFQAMGQQATDLGPGCFVICVVHRVWGLHLPCLFHSKCPSQ